MLTLWLSIICFTQVSARCIWYGECPSDKPYNCEYNGDPKRINADGYKILHEICPDLDQGPESLTCCDEKQLHTLSNQISLLSHFVRRCPACDINLRNFFCRMTCDPNQAEYMSGTASGKAIVAVNMSVSRDFIQAIINSCRDVKFAAGGQDALQTICQKEARSCEPEDLMKVFSSYSPFPVQISLDGGMNGTTWNCSQAIEIEGHAPLAACSCSDCAASCPNACPFEPEGPFMVGRTTGFGFIAIILAILLISGFAAHASIKYVHGKRNVEAATDDEHTPLVSQPDDVAQNTQLFNYLLSYACEYTGRILCRYWWIFIPLGLALCCGLASGLRRVKLTTDPNTLWSVRNSRALKDKQKFDSTFGPFYRTSQVLLTPKNQSTFIKGYVDDVFTIYTFGEALSKENLRVLSRLQSDIEKLRTDDNVSLSDVCYNPTDSGCAIFSAMEFFQNDVSKLELHNGTEEGGDLVADWASHLIYCFESPVSISDPKLKIPCLARYGGIVEPFLAVAGYNITPTNCTSLVLTYLLNSTDPRSEKWEKKFLEFMSEQTFPTLDVSYSAERSIEDQISEESWADLRTIAISYSMMFLYITISLSWRPRKNDGRSWCVGGSKLLLALSSTVLVLLAVIASVGFFGLLKVPTTLLIFEVVPFLILAIGVDNIFILTRQCQKSELPSAEDIVAEGMHIVGPGILMASCAEITAFLLASIFSTVYAVRLFALYASVALVLNILLQTLVFVPLLYLDCARVQAGRPDLFCCLKFPAAEPVPTERVNNEGAGSTWKITRTRRRLILLAFLSLPALSIGLMGKLNYGLEPSIMVPSSSYLNSYLKQVGILHTGPPVFYVLENVDLSNISNQNAICGGFGCNADSMMAQISVAEVCSNLSRVRRAPSCWLDGFADWISTPGCCREDKNGQYCPSDNTKCGMCKTHLDPSGRPYGEEFQKYLSFYLADNPNMLCPFGGKPLYGRAVKQNASYFMGYHSTLKASPDFVQALRNSWKIVDDANNYLLSKLGANKGNVYSYSVFYVFYEQYLTMNRQLLINLGAALAVLFLVTLLFTGFNVGVSLAVLLAAAMILVDIIGLMVIWSIPMNAIAMVNLIMSVGIAVEFCAHIAMNFIRNTRIQCPYQRAKLALTEVGASVFAGIGLTKLIGISVLAFAQSELFIVLFFRMYLCLILLGIVHGMIFLPTLLSLIGHGKEDEGMDRESHLVSVFSDDLDDTGF